MGDELKWGEPSNVSRLWTRERAASERSFTREHLGCLLLLQVFSVPLSFNTQYCTRAHERAVFLYSGCFMERFYAVQYMCVCAMLATADSALILPKIVTCKV